MHRWHKLKSQAKHPTKMASLEHNWQWNNRFGVNFRRLFAHTGQSIDGSKMGQSWRIFASYFLAHFLRCSPLRQLLVVTFFTHSGQRTFLLLCLLLAAEDCGLIASELSLRVTSAMIFQAVKARHMATTPMTGKAIKIQPHIGMLYHIKVSEVLYSGGPC